MTTFLDTSILISLLKPSEANHVWAKAQFDTLIEKGPIIISDVVYSEISVTYPDVAAVDLVLNELGVSRYPGNDQSLFTAGRAFHKYKKVNKGKKTGVLADFFIGATAHEENAPLLTDNKRDFTGYFDGLTLIVPPKPITMTAVAVAPAPTAGGSIKTGE